MLDKPLSYGLVVAVLMLLAIAARSNTLRFMRTVEAMKFHELEPPELAGLNLDRG